MKRIINLLVVVTLLLLIGVVLHQVQNSVVAQPGAINPPSLRTVEQGVLSGGSYRLTSLTWHVSGTTSGMSYRLQGPAAPSLRGSGCCCTYLPCALRNR